MGNCNRYGAGESDTRSLATEGAPRALSTAQAPENAYMSEGKPPTGARRTCISEFAVLTEVGVRTNGLNIGLVTAVNLSCGG